MINSQEVMNAQAETVKVKQLAAVSSRMLHGLEKIQLEKDEATRALALKLADPKATLVAIDATLASEFSDRREKLLKSEEEYKKADIESTYNENLLSIMKIVAQQK